MSEPAIIKNSPQRQIPRIVAAIDDIFEEGRGMVISGAIHGANTLDITIGSETITVDRATFVKQSAVYG